MSETGNDETYKARVVAELLERLPTLCVRPDSASRHDVWLLAGELMHTRAALAQLQQERDALLEALEHVVAVLPSPIWNEHQVLVWSQLDIEKMRAALATSQKGAK